MKLLPLAFTAVAISGTLAARPPITRELSLTPDQQMTVRQIFADARRSEEALKPKMSEQDAALRAAIKANNEAEIDRIIHGNCALIADFHALHAKAMAKVYQLLTPTQKTKYDQMDIARLWYRWAAEEAVTP